MIHYHGSPLGGEATGRSRFYTGRHALVSFAYQQDLGICLDVCQSVVLDNGAFTTWRQGKTFDCDAYGVWIEGLSQHPSVSWHLIPDIIDGRENDNRALVSEWMRNSVISSAVPVYHMHESLSYLGWLADNFPLVAIGSSGEWPNPGAKSWWIRMSEIMNYICDDDGRPVVKLHGLRMLNPDVFRFLPLASADSANAARNSGDVKRYGMYVPPSRTQRANVIADRVEQYQSAPVWDNTKTEKLCSTLSYGLGL